MILITMFPYALHAFRTIVRTFTNETSSSFGINNGRSYALKNKDYVIKDLKDMELDELEWAKLRFE